MSPAGALSQASIQSGPPPPSSDCPRATVTETIELCKVSENYKARNSKNTNPNEDEQFWEEGIGKIQISINTTPNFRAALPKGAGEGAWRS